MIIDRKMKQIVPDYKRNNSVYEVLDVEKVGSISYLSTSSVI